MKNMIPETIHLHTVYDVNTWISCITTAHWNRSVWSLHLVGSKTVKIIHIHHSLTKNVLLSRSTYSPKSIVKKQDIFHLQITEPIQMKNQSWIILKFDGNGPSQNLKQDNHSGRDFSRNKEMWTSSFPKLLPKMYFGSCSTCCICYA